MVAPVYARDMQRRASLGPILFIAMIWAGPSWADSAWVHTSQQSAPVRFAMNEVEAALRARGYTFDGKIDPVIKAPITADVSVHFWPTRDQAWIAAFLTSFYADEKMVIPDRIPAEGFILRRTGSGHSVQFNVFSGDAAGAMYGGLELAEQLRLKGVDGVVDTERVPFMPMRGTKFNIPLDLRTPSYSDMSDSAQQNIATVWDFDF